MPNLTPHQQIESSLTAYGLSLPETSLGPGWGVTRALLVTGKTFVIFGGKDEALDALTIILKLPISAQMVQHLPFIREGSAWYKQHNWVIAHFGPDDDVVAETEMLKGWLKQSYVAMAPRRLGRLVQEQGG